MKHYTRYEIKDALICYSYSISIFITTMLICYSCSTTKKTPEQKAYEARLKQIADLQILRQEFPCDTSTVYITQTDTAFITLEPDTVIKEGIRYVTKDRVITTTQVKQVTIVDSAAIEEMRLNNLQAQYLLQNCQEGANKLADDIKQKDDKIDSLRKFKAWTTSILGGLFLIVILYHFFKPKFL